ncbi:SOS response-associated peptidase [Fictibacillus sp. BK138]|uniref:SOS response-associated peptidase n=1 Tax=Fictibacillus sp. BK138 TaxID=2512121 RepID=UPI0010294969|nr:SOS response-associated peptidase [Fictibacillus sp. BK138]RZT23344.1 putative SOS response-associated peptidase YedK [Fictibacillus sp. BK138]
MCGRYFLYYDKDFIIDAFNIVNEFDYEDRFNIAPTQDVLAVIKGSTGNRAGYMKWGLIPKWAKDPKVGNKLINARSETIEEKPSFKESFYQKRCLIPASGFYEWVKEGDKKQPYQFTMEDKKPFAFAGIWSRWNQGPAGEDTEKITCSILTKESNSFMSNYHHRMPVMLRPHEGELWLERGTDKDILLELLSENNPELTAEPVTRDLNTR